MSDKLWRDFFMSLISFERILIEFHLANEAKFIMMLPERDEIKENTFSEERNFPFSFNEIQNLKMLYSLGDHLYLKQDEIKKIKNTISKNRNVQMEEGTSYLLICPGVINERN